MPDTVVITADRAIVPGGARGPTAILAEDGLIVAVGDPATIAADPRAANARTIDWSRRAVVPGTVESATIAAIRREGLQPLREPIRGGTDGSRLSAMGLPTPNIFTGGHAYHSVREWASLQDMAAAAAVIVHLAEAWA